VSTVSLALPLLVLAALLAGLAAAARSLASHDGRPRTRLLAIAAGTGLGAAAVAVAPVVLGGTVPADLSSLLILGAAGLVAAADLTQVSIGLRRSIRAWPARAALRDAETARATGDLAAAAAAYRRAIEPLARGSRFEGELNARLDHAEALAASGDLVNAPHVVAEAVRRARVIDDPRLTWTSLLRASSIASDLDRLDVTRTYLGEAAAIALERLTGYHLAVAFADLAWVGYLDADVELAGMCLAWAGRAMGKIDAASQFAGVTTLAAAQLALATGDLQAAESAIAAVQEISATVPDPDLDAGVRVARCCLAYAQGWRDSARDALVNDAPALRPARWRSRLVIPLVAVTLQARSYERPEDAKAIGEIAASLAPPGGTLQAFANECADSAIEPGARSRATRVARLLAGAAPVKAPAVSP
jgi:hypothetical protein